MKRLLLSLGLLAGVTFAAQAQSITYGIKAGGSLTNVTGKNITGSDYRVGFNGGFFANIAVNDAFSIQPEILYSMRGDEGSDSYTTSGLTYTISSKTTLHYIDVPVLARFNAKINGLFFELGPQIGFLVSANATLESNGQSESQDIKSSLSTVDFGYVAGLGYQLANGPGVGLHYNGGFTDIQKDNSGSGAAHNSAFQLYLSYSFGGK